ncbi:MAG: hypothetical protein ACI4SG_03880 [Oligosphaeraceae bacterium]
MKDSRHFLLFFLALALTSLGLHAREIILQGASEIPVYFTPETPVVDGKLTEPFWEGVPAIPMYLSGKTSFETGRSEPAYPAVMRWVHDGEWLILAVDAVNPAAPGGEPGKNCWERDGVELVFSCLAGQPSSASQVVFLDRFGQIQVAPRNAMDIPLAAAQIQAKAVQHEGGWTAEVAIPLSKLAIGLGEDFYALLGRGNYEQDEISASAPNVNSFHDWQATRRCRLLHAPLGMERLPSQFPCDSRRFQRTLTFVNFSSREVVGELRACRTEKSFESLGHIAFPPGRREFAADFPLVNHSLPVWLELRGEDGRLLWRTAEYQYAGNSIQEMVDSLPGYHSQSGHPYFQELHRRLTTENDPMEVFKAEEKTLKRLLAPLRNGKPDFLKNPFYFYVASSMAKDASGNILPDKLPLAQEAKLTAAKGETVNFQVRVMPLDKTVKGLTVKEFHLFGIPMEETHAYRVIDLHLPGDGIYPDALSRHLTVDLTPEMNSTTYFFSVSIPRDQAAGTYRGRAVLQDAEDNELACDITLKVWDFALPETPRMYGVISYTDKLRDLASDFPAKNVYQLDKMFREAILRYGFMPFRGCSHPDFLDQEHMRLYEDWRELDRRFGMIHLGSLPWYYDWLKGFYEYNKNRKEKTAQDYMKTRIQEFVDLADVLRAQGCNMENAFAYYDELESSGHLLRIGQEPDNSESLTLLKELKERSGLKLFTCFCFPSEGDDVPAAESVVDFFLFNSNYFPEGRAPLCDIPGLKARGKRVGWYWNVDKSPISFNMVNWPDNVGLRLHFHKMHRLGMEYTLFWGLCASAVKTRFDRASEPWISRLTGGVDGILMYPEDGGLTPSLRMELLRESYNDGRLITMAEELAKGNPGNPAARRIQEMLQDNRFFANPRKCVLTDQEVLAFHDELCALVEKLTR